ncbi:hypothetical protein GQ53DRAFT_57429 [Thozetella sp. PMI_491]|nr:hypothetical protein GQ53DRAFT_57429 [Thozetella sp. PMI_491]
MANQTPSTPVKVPATAASYTPATLDPDLRSQINALLIRDGHVTSIQDQLLHSLHSNHANWPTLIQTHALNLLRSGEITTFPALIRRVMDDIRQDTANKASSTNGTGEVNGSGSKKANGTAENGREGSANDGGATGQLQRRGAANEPPSLALPAAVLEDALRVTREALEMVCEVEDGGAT